MQGFKANQLVNQYQARKRLSEQVMHGFFEQLKRLAEAIGDKLRD